MKNKKVQIALSFICLILSFIITIQFKSVKLNDKVENTRLQRAEELQVELKQEKDKSENLYQELLQNEKQLSTLQKSNAENDTSYKQLLEQTEKLQTLAGVTDVEGPGVIVTLNDSKLKQSIISADDQNLYIIHDEDIWMVINELADAGAEAISLNDERLVGTSEIRCAGATVSVNNNRHAVPFVIKAIGNPDTLEAAINLRGGVKEYLTSFGLDFSLKKTDKVLVQRYTGVRNFKYAIPVKKEGN